MIGLTEIVKSIGFTEIGLTEIVPQYILTPLLLDWILNNKMYNKTQTTEYITKRQDNVPANTDEKLPPKKLTCDCQGKLSLRIAMQYNIPS